MLNGDVSREAGNQRDRISPMSRDVKDIRVADYRVVQRDGQGGGGGGGGAAAGAGRMVGGGAGRRSPGSASPPESPRDVDDDEDDAIHSDMDEFMESDNEEAGGALNLVRSFASHLHIKRMVRIPSRPVDRTNGVNEVVERAGSRPTLMTSLA